MNTIAFAACFMVWTMYGVLVTWLVDNKVLTLDRVEMGWLIGIPILTGSILRLPLGLLTDRLGGRKVFVGVMLFTALALVFTSFAQSFTHFVLGGLLFGVSGASFAVGIAYTSLWFPKERQGTALGIFGVGNAGAALSTLLAPNVLKGLTDGGQNVEKWRLLPQAYAGVLVLIAAFFWLMTSEKKNEGPVRSMGKMLAPLKDVRVWRFGLYYALLFGGFVALAQWLVPYYLNVYGTSLATAGLLATAFSLPSGATRAIGGIVSDRIGARRTMYWVLGLCVLLFLLLVAPRMEITSPGEGVMADKPGTVTAVSKGAVTVDGHEYLLKTEPTRSNPDEKALILPQVRSWQVPTVQAGDKVTKKQIIARGVTHLFFQANMWVFSVIVLLAGLTMGLGMAAVYKHIPDYFPNDVGVVGGLVGVLGGLGGFVLPIVYGYLLKSSGLWTTCWLLLAGLSVVCLVWMHRVILLMSKQTFEKDG